MCLVEEYVYKRHKWKCQKCVRCDLERIVMHDQGKYYCLYIRDGVSVEKGKCVSKREFDPVTKQLFIWKS